MHNKLKHDAEQYTKQNRLRRIRDSFVRFMACIVVFCTTYALILPAITMEKQQCGLEEHTHSESCYQKVEAEPVVSLACTYESLGVHEHTSDCFDSENNLLCGFADFVVHQHNDACRDGSGNLVCRLPVIKEHKHTEDCYWIPEEETPAPKATEAAHVHDESCYTACRGDLICQIPERTGHSHGDACYGRGDLVCQIPEQEGHTHSKSCRETVLTCDVTADPHHHTDGCYEQLVCELEEDENHTHSEECSGLVLDCDLTEEPHEHTDGCYETVTVCDLPEQEGHAHSDACYDSTLVCELAEEEGHAHTDSCYEEILAVTCGLEEGVPSEAEEEEDTEAETAEPVLVCEKEEIRLHTHGETCYETSEDGSGKWLICTKLEVLSHSHGEDCFVTEEIPAEDETVLTCTETENHTHSDLCYGTWELICGKEEHTHTDECLGAEETEETTAPTEETTGATEETTGATEETTGATEETTGATEETTSSTEETTSPVDPMAEIKGTLTQIESAILGQNPQIGLMAVLPKDYLVEPTPIEGSSVTWEVYLNGLGEYVLRFDGEGAIPDYPGNSPERGWIVYLDSCGGPYVHLEFGEGVTTVGRYSMQSLYILSIDWGGIEEIKGYGFSYGAGPKILEIDGSVKRVQDSAFYVRRVQGFKLHEGIQSLGHSCFSSNIAVDTTLHIPASVTEIPSTLYASVTAYTVAEDNPNFCAVDGVLFSKDMKTLMSYPPRKQVDEYRIPEGVETTRPYAFAGSVRIGRLVVPTSVKSMQFYLAQGGYIEEVHIEDGSNLQHTGDNMWNKVGLTNIRYPENTAIPLRSFFVGAGIGALDRYTHFTIPNKITSIGTMRGALRNLETLTYNAENADITTEKLFDSSAPYDLIIGDQVNHLPAKFDCIVSPSKAIYFQGENTFTADSGAFDGAGEPLENLSGKFYVDANGVLYQCMDDGTAKVVYASVDVPADLIIPASIQTDDSTTYRVTAVGTNAFRSAKQLSSLSYEVPQQITDLAPYAMANCPTLQSVNGKSTKEEAEATFPEDVTKTQLFINTGLHQYSGDLDGDGILDGTGYTNLTVKREGATDMDIILRSGGGTMQWEEKGSGTGLHKLLTGDTLIVTATVGNTEGNEDFTYRIYVRKTVDDGTLDISPGQTYTFDGQTAICNATEDPNTVYLEFQPTVGSTVSIPINAVYPSPGSPGGGMEIWGVIQTAQETQNTVNTVVAGEKIIQVHWDTKPDDFKLSKTGSTATVGIVSNGSGGGKPKDNFVWTITMQRATEETSSYGKDYVQSVAFADMITLPEGFSWQADLREAVKSGTVKLLGNDFYYGGIKFATVSYGSTGAPTKHMEAYWDTGKDTLAFRWEMSNGNEAEMNASTVTVTVYPEAMSIDMTKVDTTKGYTIRNDVTADVHYHYSAPVTLSASADNTVKGGKAEFTLTKTSSGPKFFGQDVTYTVDLYNKGAVPYVGQEGKIFTVVDELSLYSYIKPEDMERMFRLYGIDLVIEISDAVLAPWQSVTGVDGNTAWQNSGNSDLGTAGHTLVVSITSEGKYQVNEVVNKQETTLFTADTAAAALQGAGYAVTKSATYKCTWTLHEPGSVFTLDADEHKLFYVYATVKDSFGIISKDWPGSYPSNESVNVYNAAKLMAGSSQQAYGAVSDNVKREAYVVKTAYKDDQEQYDGGSIVNGDVLTYHLDFYHYGTGSYENLPMVDDLYGSQYLLVPVAGNDGLAGKNLPIHNEGEIAYYVLKEGSYTDVTVGVDDEGHSLIAASITVGKATDDVQVEIGGKEHSYSGIHTEIKWYFPEKPGEEYWLQVRYKALVDLNQGGITYTIGNAVWMNDRTNASIYDFIWGGDTIIDYKKEIVTSAGDTYADDVTAKYSQIHKGGQVLYRMALHNTGNNEFLLTGNYLGDGLPVNYGIFQWDKTNVALAKIETDSDTIEYSNLDQWYFADSYGGMEGDNRQYIVWPENASIQFREESSIYLYFTLTFPGEGDADLWNRYASAVNGNRISNTLYVYRFPSTVEHDLLEPGKVLLQKGVSGMYYYATTQPDFSYHNAGTTRQYYNNRDMKYRAVMYYVTLYNGGSKRLYLDDLYDQLPKGFTFIQMVGSSPVGNHVSSSFTSIITAGGVLSDGSGLTSFAGGAVVYRSATVKPEQIESGIKFRISGGTGDYTLRYDQENEKYYLNSGEAIAFAYTCDTGTAETTEERATNTIAMPYDDYLGTGLAAIPMSELPVCAEESEVFLDTNDGTRLVMSNQEVVDRYGFPSGSEPQWLVSDVTVVRGGIRPGVTKYTDAYTAEGGNRQEYKYSAIPTAAVHWRVRLHNAGTLSLVDYTFEDIMPKPYVFEGDIIFRYYDAHGNLIKEQTIVTLPQRTTGAASLSVVTGFDKTAIVPLNGNWVDISNNTKDLFLSVGCDESGNEVLQIACKAANMAIQEGGYVDVTLSSRNPTNDHINTVYTNRATIHPKAQPFDNVGHGSMLKDELGKPVGAENYSPVNVSFGYATRSEKWVAEDAIPENTAVSSAPDKNRIVLESGESTFTYKLVVGNETELPMTKLVVIDNLPEPGDHTPFDTSVSRNSAFKVCFADDPDFRVTVTDQNGGAQVLTSDHYTLEFSENTDFGGPQSNDWKGIKTDKWNTTRAEDARAFRLIIEDEAATLIPHESQIEVTFKARADRSAEPGTVAWNNFGYHYGLKNVGGELEAMPLTVGVSIPAVPIIEKKLVDASGVPVKAETDSEFPFLVYQGGALTGNYESEAAILAALSSENRAVKRITALVEAGKSESDPVMLDMEGWNWTQRDTYTVMELPVSDRYGFQRFDGSASSSASYTFVYDKTITQKIVCVNELEEWKILLTKTDMEGTALPGAVFGLYSPAEKDQLSSSAAAQWNAELTKEAEGETWYLKAVGETGEEGVLSWEGLREDRYYLLEIKAPAGYNLSKTGQILYRSDSTEGTLSLTVENSPGYELPDTGGTGTYLYTMGGLLLMMAAAVLLYLHKKPCPPSKAA